MNCKILFRTRSSSKPASNGDSDDTRTASESGATAQCEAFYTMESADAGSSLHEVQLNARQRELLKVKALQAAVEMFSGVSESLS